MKIARYIGDLLYDYECVVIPGLGGFLTSNKPASIHPITHYFRPPHKQVLFNAFLKTNDGLLLNYIAKEMGVSYKEAKEQLDHFVLLCTNALKEGKRINFQKVGYLYLNKHEQITFEQDSNVNYNADAFGLGTFVSPAVRRPSAEEKLRDLVSKEPAKAVSKKESKKPQPVQQTDNTSEAHTKKKLMASKRKSPYRSQLTFLSLLILAMLVGWGFMNKETLGSYYNNYASVIPFFYSNPNTYLINNIDHVPLSKISKSKTGLWIVNLLENTDKQPSNIHPLPATKAVNRDKRIAEKANNKSNKDAPVKLENKLTTQQQPAVSVPVLKVPAKVQPSLAVSPTKQYYIMAGAFKDSQNALRLVNELKEKGFQATQAGLTSYGLYRVAFAVFKSRKPAEQQLLAIRQSENPSAWILEK